ncbi:MAG: SH3 domain-containing protein [Clostridia bacterium]|nr:SH3 domain-containing protein [Clostridia bacterium]
MKKIISKNKSLFIILIVAILFISYITVYAYSSLTSFKPTYGTLTSNVNFRTTASTSTGKIRTLSKGTKIKMVGTIDNFYIVQLGTNEVGVVSKSYVKSSSTAPSGAKTYTRIAVKTFTTTDKVNLRRGPGTNFGKITTISKGTSLKAVGYIGDWYVVVTSNNKVGCIRKDLLKTSSTSSGNTSNTTTTTSFSMSANEKIIFDLLNKARTDAGLPKLSADATLFKVARLKAQDMVKNSYFSHTSPTYGSPFKMMKTYGVSYKVAGENIAGNPSLQDAVTAWLNSPTHRQNILSNSYNYIGIGIEKSDTYGYVISTMFIR